MLKPAVEGGFIVTCRDLPPLITQGETRDHALSEAADAMDEVFATYMLGKLDFPVPSKLRRGEYWIAPPAETVAKAALYTAMRAAGISNVQLAKALNVDGIPDHLDIAYVSTEGFLGATAKAFGAE